MLVRASSGSGGGGGVDSGTFTTPSSLGVSVTVNCGFQPKKVIVFSGVRTDYKQSCAFILDTEDSTKGTTGYGNGYWYSASSNVAVESIISVTSSGFSFTLPSALTAGSYLCGQTVNYIAIP